MKVKIDAREGKRIKQATLYFDKQGYQVSTSQMKYGDFVCGNCCIEYKTTRDFITSVQTKRVFRQAINMKNNFKHSYVFIEAEHDKRDRAIRSSQFHGMPFSWQGFYGAVASLSTYSNVIIVKNFTEALKLMNKLFEKCNDNSSRTFIPPQTTSAQWIVNFLACDQGDGIGVKLAEKIMNGLELKTLADLFDVTKEDLMSIRGVGEATADKIMRRIK